ncbi:MAG: hypothetical protein CM15mP84_08410 [Cellvibrionales bacterium]|nr:MAG: hypothetical protein CM15mP84_08410 [Cellvibrionales bacterium]
MLLGCPRQRLTGAVSFIHHNSVSEFEDSLLIPCSSSPPPGNMQQKKSTIPLPDVPTANPYGLNKNNIEPLPPHRAAATPRFERYAANARPAGEGLMNAASSRDSASIRVLSPRMEPPATGELGSTANTARR